LFELDLVSGSMVLVRSVDAFGLLPPVVALGFVYLSVSLPFDVVAQLLLADFPLVVLAIVAVSFLPFDISVSCESAV